MKRTIVIEKIEDEDYTDTILYSIRFIDEQDSEYQKFYKKFENDKSVKWSFNVIDYRITLIIRGGAEDEHFRREGGAVKALPSLIETSKLRLYCYRVNEHILIIGNGGLKIPNPDKNKNKLIDFPELNLYAETLRVIGEGLQKEIDSGLVGISSNNELQDLEPIEIEITE